MKVLVVDDDRVLADVVAFTLRREGFQVILAYDGKSALKRWAEDEPDLIVLDINLPYIDGFTVCKRIREQADTPILLLTVRSEEDDIVHGLELGADDYITKPFSPKVLIARVRTALRRKTITPDDHVAVIHINNLEIHPGRRSVLANDNPVDLTFTEFQVLHLPPGGPAGYSPAA